MHAKTKHVIKLVLGWALVVLGIAGLVLPILQGFLFLAIGLGILARESPWVCRHVQRLRHRFPNAAAKLDAAEEGTKGWLRRLRGSN